MKKEINKLLLWSITFILFVLPFVSAGEIERILDKDLGIIEIEFSENIKKESFFDTIFRRQSILIVKNLEDYSRVTVDFRISVPSVQGSIVDQLDYGIEVKRPGSKTWVIKQNSRRTNVCDACDIQVIAQFTPDEPGQWRMYWQILHLGSVVGTEFSKEFTVVSSSQSSGGVPSSSSGSAVQACKADSCGAYVFSQRSSDGNGDILVQTCTKYGGAPTCTPANTNGYILDCDDGFVVQGTNLDFSKIPNTSAQCTQSTPSAPSPTPSAPSRFGTPGSGGNIQVIPTVTDQPFDWNVLLDFKNTTTVLIWVVVFVMVFAIAFWRKIT